MKKKKDRNIFYAGKRLLDLFFSFLLIIITFPLFLVISLIIIISDGWPVFFIQERVGKNWTRFHIYKFRTMHKDTPKYTIGKHAQNRLIRGGSVLRKFHLDELPQLINILKNEMSFVGPRPEIEKFAKQYDQISARIFQHKPGITSPASIEFSNETERMQGIKNQEKYYITKIVPEKIIIDLEYFGSESLLQDLQILYRTLFRSN